MKENDIDRLLQDIEEQCGEDTDLVDRYKVYSKVDAEKAHQEMRQKIEGTKVVPMWRRYRYGIAAAITALIVGGAFWLWQNTRVVPPEISENIKVAMAQSESKGFAVADVEDVSISEDELIVYQGEDFEIETEQPAKEEEEQLDNVDAEKTLLQAKRVTTRHDKEFWLTLPDGTIAHLNYNTRLIYPEKFGKGDRDVILDGEAYFMVAKDRRHPFIVHTPHGDVKVYGTEFVVNTRAENGNGNANGNGNGERGRLVRTNNGNEGQSDQLSVVLVKGSISFTPVDGKEQKLKPGQEYTYFNHQSSIQAVDTAPYVAWNEGKFSFQEWSLERVMEVMSRWYGMQVHFTDDQLRAIAISGNFDRYEDLRPTMEAIAAVTDLDISIKDDMIIVSE